MNLINKKTGDMHSYDLSRYKHKPKLEDRGKVEVCALYANNEVAEIGIKYEKDVTPDNGGERQPVEDISKTANAVAAQERRFSLVKKIMGDSKK